MEGFLIGASSWDFKDEASGRDVVGAKLLLATPSDAEGHYGFSVTEIPIDMGSKREVCAAANSLAMTNVIVSLTMAPRGKKLSAVAKSIKAV